MADQLEEKLATWSGSTNDDLDLRTEDGVRRSAERYAKRNGVTLDLAMDAVNERIDRQKAISAAKPVVSGELKKPA